MPQAVQQRPGILEHDSRLFALIDKLRDELAHPFVAPVENGSVMVVADSWIIHHVLEIADDVGGGQILAAGGDQRLVHVQGNGKRAVDVSEINPAI